MTITHSASSGIEVATGAKGSSATNIAYVGVAAGRLAIAMVTVKAAPATATWSAPPEGWQICADVAGGTAVGSNDAGQTRLGAWWRVLRGNESGNATFASSAANSMGGGMSVYAGTLGAWGSPLAVTGDDATHGTGRTCVCGAWPTALATGDFVVLAYASDTDNTAAVSAPTITQTSGVFASQTMRNQRLSNNGFQCGLYSADCSVTTGNANAPTIGFTYATSQCGPGAAIRLRELAPGATPSLAMGVHR